MLCSIFCLVTIRIVTVSESYLAGQMLLLIAVWLIILLTWWYLDMRHVSQLGKKLPGPTPYPFLGNLLLLYGKPERVFKTINRIHKKYSRLFTLWVGPKLCVFLCSAKDTEEIMKQSKNTLKSEEYQLLKPWLGESILISEGAKFKHNRKLLSASFHTQNLKQYIQVFNVHADELVKDLSGKIGPEEFDIQPLLYMTTMCVLLETSMGVKKETLGDQALTYAKAVDGIGRCMSIRMMKLWLRPDIFFRFSKLKSMQDKHLHVINTLTAKIIDERKVQAKALQDDLNGNVCADTTSWPVFLDSFQNIRDENGVGLSAQDIQDEVSTMMFAGQDTTTVSIGFALSLLGLHQDVQDKLIKEIDILFGRSDRPFMHEDAKNLPYLEQVIQETWRLYPPIPMIAKKPISDIQIDDYILPEKCTMCIMIMLVHRDPTQYPEPNKFNPDNFLPERIKERNPYSFLPFSAGHRTCIGQKYAMLLIKVVLSHIFRHYRVHATIPTYKFKLAGQTSLKRRDGFKISLIKREE